MPALKTKQEAFAKAIAAGTAGADAYSALYPKASRKTATEKASRWARIGNIAARIAQLRSALADAQAKREADVAKDVASKLNVALLTSQERRSLIASRARREDITDSALVALLHLDAKLAGDLHEKFDVNMRRQTEPKPIIFNIPSAIASPRPLPPQHTNAHTNGHAVPGAGVGK